jgi:beta-barrel assembly-enhancing protease
MLRTRFAYVSLILAFLYIVIPCEAKAVCIEEMNNATSLANQIDHEWPLRPVNDRVTNFIQNLGKYLISHSVSRKDSLPISNLNIESWSFTVVRDLSVNAFSIGNGRIYITDGSLALTNSEDELAAVISHEIGHQLAGHFCEKSTSSGFDFFKNALNKPQKQIGIGSMSLTLDPVKEQQADYIAIRILQASGYDPRAILTIAKRLPTSNHHLVYQSRIGFLSREVTNFPVEIHKKSTEYLAIQQSLIN